jgi:opacity protein-like surface antigen
MKSLIVGVGAQLTGAIVLLLILLAISPGAIAQGAEKIQITAHVGYRMGGEFEDYASGREISLSDDQGYGFSIESVAGTSGTEYGLFYSLQETQLELGGFGSSVPVSGLDVEYLHIRSKRRARGNTAAYTVGSLGITRFNPETSTFSSESRFSLGAGVGIELPLTPGIGIQFEGRGFATFLDSNGALFCSSQGSCSVRVAGSVLWQFEVATALVFRF